MWYESLAYSGLIPDLLIRALIRYKLSKYEKYVGNLSENSICKIRDEFIKIASQGAIAIETQAANSQHYEFPTSFYSSILGPSLKYSGSLWKSDANNLESADLETLKIYTSRAQIQNGQSVLDIGCGWGSLSLYIGKTFNDCKVTAVTNSTTQQEYLNSQIQKHNLANVSVNKVNINNFQPVDKYDRALSIEMFEHTRNTKLLMENINDWLNQKGKLFIQVFSHSIYPQFFDNYSDSWMSRNFFSGGMMPYSGFHQEISGRLNLVEMWEESGTNYHKSLEAWLNNLDYSKNQLIESLEIPDQSISPKTAINKFRIFLLFCSELFNHNQGMSWKIMNYLFTKQETR
jgi:cyclopropane-fatty-acyl-phospholipid synthase